MKLSEFVSNALTQIVQGVKEAQGKVSEHGASVNPRLRGSSSHVPSGWTEVNYNRITRVAIVRFGVAVTESTEGGGSAGLSVLGGLVRIGGEVGSRNSEGTASRIQFEVAVDLPSVEDSA